MKILSAENTRRADEYTIKNEPIRSVDLMERASGAFVSVFLKYFPSGTPVHIFCGTGNNGGDGLAVGRLLSERGYKINVFVINPKKKKGSADFEINMERLRGLIEPVILEEGSRFPEDLPRGVLIDAVFGSGLTRPLEGFYASIIEKMNLMQGHKVSIDIASGLFADKPLQDDIIFKPDLTITFQTPKLAFMIPENHAYTGRFEVVDIGLDREFINSLDGSNHFITIEDISGKLIRRERFAHKGMFGHAIIIAGSLGKMGAAVLSGRACLRTGVGLLTLHVPACGYEILQNSVPEAMTTVDPCNDLISGIPDLSKANVAGVGPGIGMDPHTKDMLYTLFKEAPGPLVIDADAINLMGRYGELLDIVPQGSILTPHLKEFERVAGKCSNHFERLDRQKKFSADHGVTVILKGANTAVSFPDGHTYFNSSGNPGMATGGSGDVLTGIVTGFLAKNYTPETAAMLGTFLHGLAGDLAAAEKGIEGMIASDIIDFLPEAIKKSETPLFPGK